jgi:hypothetical protein
MRIARREEMDPNYGTQSASAVTLIAICAGLVRAEVALLNLRQHPSPDPAVLSVLQALPPRRLEFFCR